MKARFNMSLVFGTAALLLLAGCVSSRKYKASQAALAKVRSDSAQLAQQITSLNGNVNDLTGKNSALQRSLDSSSSRYAEQQKSLENYQNYFKGEQDSLEQVNQDLQGVLTQAGVTNGSVQQVNDAVYVSLDENDIFKRHSAMVTPTGKKVLDGVTQVIKIRPDANVSVATGDSAIGMSSTDNGMSSTDNSMPNSSAGEAPRHHRSHARHHTPTAAGTASNGSSASAGSSTPSANPASPGSTAQAKNAPEHKRIHHHYSSEGSTAFSTRAGNSHNRNWSLKQRRMVTVADHFLKNGVPKVNVSLQRPPMGGTAQSSMLKIIIRPAHRNFSPRQNSSASAGSE